MSDAENEQSRLRLTPPDQCWYEAMIAPPQANGKPLFERLNRDGWPRFRVRVEAEGNRDPMDAFVERSGGVELTVRVLRRGRIEGFPSPEHDPRQLLGYDAGLRTKEVDGIRVLVGTDEKELDASKPLDPADDWFLRLDLMLGEMTLELARLVFLARLSKDPAEREQARRKLFLAAKTMGITWRGYAAGEAYQYLPQKWFTDQLIAQFKRGRRVFKQRTKLLGKTDAADEARREIEPEVQVLLHQWKLRGGSPRSELLARFSHWEKIFTVPTTGGRGQLRKRASRILGVEKKHRSS